MIFFLLFLAACTTGVIAFFRGQPDLAEASMGAALVLAVITVLVLLP